MTETSHFDRAAQTWDDHPRRHALMTAVARAVREQLGLQEKDRLMEYGCGTASLSLMLAESVAHILAVDASAGMIEQAEQKIAASDVKNISTLQADFVKESYPNESFDVIVSAMALHHIDDVDVLLKTFADTLAPGGRLAIADLYEENGEFHGDMDVPHDGFDPAHLARRCAAAGLSQASWGTVHHIDKNERRFPVFLLTAHLPE